MTRVCPWEMGRPCGEIRSASLIRVLSRIPLVGLPATTRYSYLLRLTTPFLPRPGVRFQVIGHRLECENRVDVADVHAVGDAGEGGGVVEDGAHAAAHE